MTVAHRLALQVDRDDPLDGQDAHHVPPCDERSCVNPDHMEPVERQAHRWQHAKTRNMVRGVCTGTTHCLCLECCDRKAAEAEAEVPF